VDAAVVTGVVVEVTVVLDVDVSTTALDDVDTESVDWPSLLQPATTTTKTANGARRIGFTA
jgi:hypothetical protein